MAAVAQVRLRALHGRGRAGACPQARSVAHGISFHVGSQQPNQKAWDRALASAAAVFRECGERGITLSMVNLGGGFPTRYLKKVPTVKAYGSAIFRALRKHFGNRIPETIIEPGRGMVGNAGVIEAEVVLVSKKSNEDEVRWVYLDIGKFGGLAETMDESIRYPIRTPRDGDAMAPCVLAGPTCDSADVLYEKEPVPAAGQPGDRRQGADRRHRRLYGDLLVRGLQRLPAAEDLPHLSTAPADLPPAFAGEAAAARDLPNPPGMPGRDTETEIAMISHSPGERRPTPPPARRCSTRPTARSASPSLAAAARRSPAGARTVVRRGRGRPRGRHRAAVARLGRPRPAGAAARPARGRSGLRSRGIGAHADAARAPRRRQARPCAPCCWSATRRITAASASRPRRPARSGCPARPTQPAARPRTHARRARRRPRHDRRGRGAAATRAARAVAALAGSSARHSGVIPLESRGRRADIRARRVFRPSISADIDHPVVWS